MSDLIGITCLVDDATGHSELKAEHGLALLVEVRGQKILFDAGQTDLLLTNARSLGIDLSDVRTIVLSHGHNDHTGGLASVLKMSAGGTLLAHPAAFGPHYSTTTGSIRDLRWPSLTPELIRRQGWQIVWTHRPTDIAAGVTVTGPIPRRTSFEDTGGSFFLDAEARQPDPITDDQALLLTTHDGTVVLLGCAHAGVVNTLAYVRQITGQAPIHALIGGLHLCNASPQRLAATMEALAHYGVQNLAPAHCTGSAATAMLWGSFPHCCRACQAGSRFEFPL